MEAARLGLHGRLGVEGYLMDKYIVMQLFEDGRSAGPPVYVKATGFVHALSLAELEDDYSHDADKVTVERIA